jgi:hypothetical protein
MMSILFLSAFLGHCKAQSQHSSASTLGIDFVIARLDHRASEGAFWYCQGGVTILLVNPHPTQVALARIETGVPINKRTVAELSIDPGDQVEYLWKGTDCQKVADENRITSGVSPPWVLPASLGTSCRIRSSHPIQVYAAHGAVVPLASSAPRDLTMVLPTSRLGNRYRLVDADTNDRTSNPAPQKQANELPAGNAGKKRNRYTAFGVVAISDESTSAASSDAVVSVRNDVTGQVSANFTLMAGQVLWYTLHHSEATEGTLTSPSEVSLYDMTGWNVVASRPVAVFVGSYDSVPRTDDGSETVTSSESYEAPSLPASAQGASRDRLRFRTYQQILPESMLGNTYLVCPVEASEPIEGNDEERSDCLTDAENRHDAACQDPRTIPTRVRYIATHNDTVVTLTFNTQDREAKDGERDASAPYSATTTIRLEVAGQYYDLQTSQPHQAMANYPIYVYQYLPSWSSSSSAEPTTTASSATDISFISVRSSSMLLVPPIDQLLLPQDSPTSSASTSQRPLKSTESKPVRVPIQHDHSSLRLLHAKTNRIALKDEEWPMMQTGDAVSKDYGGSNDISWRERRRQLQRREVSECRTVGFLNGIEYCCTQLNHVPSGIYTISTTSFSRSSDAEVANGQYPIGISVLGYVSIPVNSSRGEVEQSSKADFEPSQLRSPTNSLNRFQESSEDDQNNVRLRLYGYNGGLESNEVAATCTTGAPYAKRTYRFPSEAYQLDGKASCREGSYLTHTVWRSLNPNGAVLTAPDHLTTSVRFRQPGVHTLCLDVSCGIASDNGEAGSASCCGTFEVNQAECDAGGPYHLELAPDNLPASVKLKGDIENCADGTQPILSWFHDKSPDVSKERETVEFAKADQLNARAIISAFGEFDVCMQAKCGNSDLLKYQCCTKIQVRKQVLDDPVSIPALPPQLPPFPPYAEVIQDSPTSRIAGGAQELPALSHRENEGKQSKTVKPSNGRSSSSGFGSWAAQESLGRPTRVGRDPTNLYRRSTPRAPSQGDNNGSNGDRNNFHHRNADGRQDGKSLEEGLSSKGGRRGGENEESGRQKKSGGELTAHGYKTGFFGSNVMPLNIFFRGD